MLVHMNGESVMTATEIGREIACVVGIKTFIICSLGAFVVCTGFLNNSSREGGVWPLGWWTKRVRQLWTSSI
jgi:hypothetical protein